MNIKKILIVIIIGFFMVAFKTDKPAYQIFDATGKNLKYSKMLEQIEIADVVFFGELHNNPICHWLQIELTRDLFEKKDGAIMLGAEMFEADNQLIMNEYVEGLISEKNYKKEAKLWPNYSTDYAPLVEFAKEHQVSFIATNIPRRYASIVYNEGFEGLDILSAEAKSYIAPLPVEYDPELKGYSSMLEEMKTMGHANDNLPKAQAIKDATMAYSIAGTLENGKTFIHFNGTYHSNDYEGIIWYLNKYKPGLKIITIASVEQEDLENLENENENKANYIIVIPDRMTKTY